MSGQFPSYESDAIDLISSQHRSTPLDESAKKIMSSREIIARLLKAVVPEFKDCSVDEILPLIGKISVNETPVDADKLPPQIVSEGTEDSTVTEGTRFYDIKFSVKLPRSEREVFIIINLEIQNKYYPGYELTNRGIFYSARLVPGQSGTVFTGDDYDKIQKVYSIWICTSPPKELANTISLYYTKRSTLLGKVKETKEQKDKYRIQNLIMIHLGDSDTKDCGGIIRMLYTLLVSDQTAQEKKDIIHNEYGIPMSKEFDKEVDHMCDISSLYIDRGIRKGIQKGIEQEKNTMIKEMHKSGIPIETIAKVAHLSVKDAKKIIEA